MLPDFIGWRYIHSWLVFSIQLVNCCPMDEGTILVYCCPLPSLLPSPPLPPSQTNCTVQYIQTVYGCEGEGGGGLNCVVDHILQGVLHSVSDQIQNLQNCFTTPNKMSSKDDIKGLVSLKVPSSMISSLSLTQPENISIFHSNEWKV